MNNAGDIIKYYHSEFGPPRYGEIMSVVKNGCYIVKSTGVVEDWITPNEIILNVSIIMSKSITQLENI